MPSERLPAPNVVSCSAYETDSVTVLRSSGSRSAGERPAPGRRPPRCAPSCIDSIILNQPEHIQSYGPPSSPDRDPVGTTSSPSIQPTRSSLMRKLSHEGSLLA